MRAISLVLTLAATAVAGGCATTGGDDTYVPRPDTGTCDADAVQGLVGQKASVENGTSIRSASGARTLRWGAPDSAWTMDYRTDRVNVRYGYDMVITEITCG